MIRAIIFDLWDTIGSKGFAISKEFRIHFDIPNTPNFLKRYETAIQLSNWKKKEDLAKNFLREFKLKQNEDNIAYIISVYEKGIKNAKLIEGMEDILRTVHKQFKLGLISNTTNFEITFIDRFKLRELFDVVVSSHEISVLKPSKKIFDEVVLRLDIPYEDCLFIDDSPANIQQAKIYGLQGIRFENPLQLREELKKIRILNS
ncbi:MAG: HAD-IA family hydrolase [Nanoarchaeota archaeon]